MKGRTGAAEPRHEVAGASRIWFDLPATAADLAPLAAGPARLDLMRRYGREESRLAADLSQAHARGDGLLLRSDFNASAQAFYERHGWTRVGALPGLVLPGVAELISWKRLRPR